MTNTPHYPTVSVVIPAYDAAATLSKTLNSVLMQSRRPDSIIVVDDASGDGTAKAADDCLASSGIPYQVIRQAENRGPAAARNAGIRAADGDWIAFLDADDAWLPYKLELQLAVLEAGGGALPGSAANAIAGKDGVCPISLRDFALRNPVATSTVLVRKDLIEAVGGFDEQFRGPEDYDLWLRMAAWTGPFRSGERAVFVCGGAAEMTDGAECSGPMRETADRLFAALQSPRFPVSMLRLNVPLVWYRVQKGSLSMNEVKFLPQVLRVIDKAYGTGGSLAGHRTRRQARAYQFACAAWAAAVNQRAGCGVKLLLQSLIEWPFPFYPAAAGRWARVKVAVFVWKRFFRKKPAVRMATVMDAGL